MDDMGKLQELAAKQEEKVGKLKENYDYAKERYEKERDRLSQLEKDIEAKKYRRMMGNLRDHNIENEEQLMRMLESLKSQGK